MAFSQRLTKPPTLISNMLKALMIFAMIFIGLSSCGFNPVYGEASSAKEVLENVMLEDPANRLEQVFLTAVEQRLAPPAKPKYQVKYSVILSYQGLDVIGASRVQVVGRVVSTLVDLNTSAVKSIFAVDGFTGYSATRNFEEVQRKDAEERLMQILADKFITRLMIQSQMLGANDG